MKILPVRNNALQTTGSSNEPAFGHHHSSQNNYTVKEKLLVGTTTALGVATSVALLAKHAGKSLNPKKFTKNIKNSYLATVKFTDKEVISIGAGSCLGGLAGGYLVDKNKDNRKAKRREAVMQIGNISIPILSVEGAAKLTAKKSKTTKTLAAIGGLVFGVYAANILMNLLSNAIFTNTSGRKVKATDFSAHLDDMVVAANYISDSKFVHGIARLIPLALMFAGNEVGNKTAHSNG